MIHPKHHKYPNFTGIETYVYVRDNQFDTRQDTLSKGLFKVTRVATTIIGKYPNLTVMSSYIRCFSLLRISEYNINMTVVSRVQQVETRDNVH